MKSIFAIIALLCGSFVQAAEQPKEVVGNYEGLHNDMICKFVGNSVREYIQTDSAKKYQITRFSSGNTVKYEVNQVEPSGIKLLGACDNIIVQ